MRTRFLWKTSGWLRMYSSDVRRPMSSAGQEAVRRPAGAVKVMGEGEGCSVVLGVERRWDRDQQALRIELRPRPHDDPPPRHPSKTRSRGSPGRPVR